MVATIPPTNQTDALEYQKQERKRYLGPLWPFSYTFEGKAIMVGPTIRNRK
jgi:hypothetical protein